MKRNLLRKEEDSDPMSVVSNLFDVAMVFAVALMVALVTPEGRFALRAGLRVCRGLRRGGQLAGGGREGRGKGWAGGCGGQSGPQAKPSGGRFRRAKPAGPGSAGAACGPVSPLCKMGRGATGTGKRYRRRGSGGGVPGGRPPCRGSRRRCAGR